ncbi:L-fucose/L-arabinose isomerase family protein [Paenibacillus validus]|uniref:L-fucose isomerase C-terminal domain-containing protein n=1 Tax=Paenibacillus validus TaxID=44253 RepID=A0A7X3CUY2_9BACL|nr:hypothetical protein [Paenibacillus validus]MUG73972.1 hypothetical protein [Paenibacillus validus]
MLETSVLYLPIGRKTFDLAAAEVVWAETSEFLKKQCRTLHEPEHILTSIEELEQFLQSVQGQSIDSVVYQSVTFADGEFAVKVLEYFKAPVIVWSVREPSVGGRLRLNSLTGGNSTCNVLKNLAHPFAFVFGNPSEPRLQEKLHMQLQVNQVIHKLKQLSIGIVGEHPPGFFFSDSDEAELQTALGVRLHKLDLQQAFSECAKIDESRWIRAVERAEKQVVGLNRSDETVKKFAQFYSFLEDYIQENRIQALAVRCWPDFFNELGAAACSTLSQFTEGGIVSSCESDIHGSISMYVLQELSGGSAPYLGDLVHVNEERNSVVFWHCGAGAYSLAHPSTGAQAGVHPNRKLGFTMEFGLKPGGVTIFRVSHTPSGYRLLVMRGNALDVPQPFNGTSVEVQLPHDVSRTLTGLMNEGFEPHFALVYEDVVDALIELGRQLGIETIAYV